MPDLQTQLSALPQGSPPSPTTASPAAPQIQQNNQSSTGIDQGALALSRSIALAESGGGNDKPNYNAIGDNGTAAGAYQWSNNVDGVISPLSQGEIPANFKSSAVKYGLDPNDFSPVNQDKVEYAEVVAQKKAGLSPEQIAAAHNAGMGKALDGSWKTNIGTTTLNGKQISYNTPEYVQKVNKYYNQLYTSSQGQSGTSQGENTTPSSQNGPQTQATSITTNNIGVPIGGNLKSNLAALPGALEGAGNAALPITGDIYNDIKGTNQKSALEQGGDAVQSALSAALLIPGAQPEDLAAKAGLTGLTARIGANAATGGLIGASNAIGQGKSAGQVATQGVEGAVGGGVLGGVSGLLKSPSVEEKLQSAIQDATPSYSSKIIGEQPIKEGLLSRSVVPTSQNVEAGTELSKVPNYPISGTNLEKYQAIEPVIAQKGQALDASLKSENVLRPPKELSKIVKDALTTTGDNSYLLQKSDPLIKNYQRVADNAIKNNEGTLYGERQVVKTLDNAYESAGGKYGNNKALDQLHRAARTALINDMELKATNTGVKASLKEMSNLYNAQDTLLDKAKSEGGTAIQRLVKNNPLASKAVGLLGRYTGLDAAIHLLP